MDDIPPIMDALFECTLEMVSKNLEDFPEHRTNFFRMLQSITQHCFPGQQHTTHNAHTHTHTLKHTALLPWSATHTS